MKIKDILPPLSGFIQIMAYSRNPLDLGSVVYNGDKYNIPLYLQRKEIDYITAERENLIEVGVIIEY